MLDDRRTRDPHNSRAALARPEQDYRAEGSVHADQPSSLVDTSKSHLLPGWPAGSATTARTVHLRQPANLAGTVAPQPGYRHIGCPEQFVVVLARGGVTQTARKSLGQQLQAVEFC